MSRLSSLEPASIAKVALDTYRDLLAKGHSDGYSRAVAIGTVVVEADDLKARTEVDFVPPNRSLVDDLEAGYGGFAPGPAGWETQ